MDAKRTRIKSRQETKRIVLRNKEKVVLRTSIIENLYECHVMIDIIHFYTFQYM